MAVIRIEPVRDERTGRYYLEIYNPHDAPAPFVTTQPRYASAVAAENDAVASLAAAASSVPEEKTA